MKFPVLVLSCLLSIPALAQKENVVRLDGISIQGSNEEPDVIYITPWRQPPGTGRLFEPVKSYRDQWLQPIDAEKLQREIQTGGQSRRAQVNP